MTEVSAEAAQLAKVGVTPNATDTSTNGPPAPKAEKTPAEAAAEQKAAAEKEAAAKAEAEKAKVKTPEELRKEAADAAEAARVKEEEAEAATNEERKDWVNQYVKLDNPSADAAIDLLREAGVTPLEANGIFEEAMKTRDISKVKWDVLEAKIGKTKTLLVKAGVIEFDNEVVSKVRENVKAVHDVMGGEDNWKKVTAWAQAKEKVDPAFKKQLNEYRKAIEVGGYVTQQTANALKVAFNADPKNNGLGVAAIVNGDTVAETGGAPLTRADYVTELKKAHDRNASPAEIKALDARRVLGRQRGI